jgi:hypothetical protein
VSEVRQIFSCLNDDATTVRTVSAVWAAAWNVSFPAKAQAAIATVAGLTEQLNLINKHR